MKRFYFLLAVLIIGHGVHSQNMGINTTTPVMPLHVASSNKDILVVENTASLAAGVETNLYFANGLSAQNPTKYTGAIKTIGTGTDYARLGLFTYASQLPSGLLEHLSILDNGFVGIGNTNPSYKLDVNGSIRTQNDLQVNGTVNSGTVLTIGNNATVAGTLTVYNGKGIVRGVNATQMKIKRMNVGFSYNNMGAGATITSSNLTFGEHFDAVTVTMGQCFNGTGEWAKLLIVPFNLDTVANTCQFRITNVGNAAIDFSGNWEVVLIGN